MSAVALDDIAPSESRRPPPMGAAPPPVPDRVDFRLAIGFTAMVFGMFMAILDIQIVASSLSQIQAGVAASADEIVWVQTSYLIAEVVMIPLSGFLSRLLSTRILFAGSALGFTATSFLCAQAASIEEMILWRTLQGFIGGAMIPTVFSTAFSAFPPRRRTLVSVTIGMVATMAPTIGPTLGGFLTEQFSWHWLFLINIVPGLMVAVAVWYLIDIDRPDWSLMSGLDWPGLASMAIFLGSLEYVIEEGARHQWFEEDKILLFSVVAAVSGLLFLARVLTCDRPIVDLLTLKDRNFAMGCLFSFITGIALYGSVYMLPLYLGQIRGLNAQQIGAVMFITGLFQFMAAPIAGILSGRIDERIVMALGFALIAGSFLYAHPITAEWDLAQWAVPQAMRGAGMMFTMVPITNLALGTLPPEQLKNASGLFNLTRNLGGAFGLAGINTLITERMALHSQRLAEWVDPARPQVAGWLEGLTSHLSTSLPGSDAQTAALRILAQTVRRDAMVMTFADLFLIMALTFLAALAGMCLLKKPALRSDPGGGH